MTLLLLLIHLLLLHFSICFVVALSIQRIAIAFIGNDFVTLIWILLRKVSRFFRLFLCSPSQTCLYIKYIHLQRITREKKQHQFRYEQIPIDIKKDEIESETKKKRISSIYTRTKTLIHTTVEHVENLLFVIIARQVCKSAIRSHGGRKGNVQFK